MKSPLKRPKYTAIAKASDFCRDILLANLQTKQNTTLPKIMESQIETTMQTLSTKKYDFKSDGKVSPLMNEKRGYEDREPDFFPFSRIALKKKEGYEASSNFFSQSNKLIKDQQQLIDKARSAEFEIRDVPAPYANQQLKREPFSFKPTESMRQQQPKFAIQETNKIWQQSPTDEISLIPQSDQQTRPLVINEQERVNQRFQQQTPVQEHLVDQYYVERDRRKSQGVKYGYINSKIRDGSFDGHNSSFIYDKLEHEVQKNLINPVEIDIKAKNRILGNQLKTKEGSKLIKLKNQPEHAYKYHKIRNNPFDPLEVATNHPEFHKNTLILASPKSLDRITEKTQKKKEVKKVNLNDFNSKYRKSPTRHSDRFNRNGLGQSAIKQILKKEAGRIKKEIETIKSNLESYRIGPVHDTILTEPIDKKAKSEKFNNLHNLIKNSLYNQ